MKELRLTEYKVTNHYTVAYFGSSPEVDNSLLYRAMKCIMCIGYHTKKIELHPQLSYMASIYVMTSS